MARIDTWRTMLAPALLAAVPLTALGQLGCSQLVCGDGTVERDGTCHPADEQPGAAACGLGTELGPGGTCVVSDPVQCDPDTTTEQLDPDTGITTCVGIGGTNPCLAELQCPTPASGKLTLCGRIYDTETDEVMQAATPTGMPCDPAAPTADGPCSLKLAFYDALLFQQMPETTAPLPAASITVDDCGRYVGKDVGMTSFGFVGAATDDAMGVADAHILTGVATADAMAVPARGFRVYATRHTTDNLWSTAAALPNNAKFSELGVLVMIFRKAMAPIAGVKILHNGNIEPANDFYFTDTTKARSMLDRTRDLTGPNGTGLFIDAPAPVPFSGTGGEPNGCRWPSALAATIPNVVFVQLKDAESNGGGPCP